MQIITKHMVRPSSPTPLAFKTHTLSSLDQPMPSLYMPLILFYENDGSQHEEQISRRLKQSLSEILTIFYPIAGTIKQNSFVDCDDSGAELLEARVHARLQQFTQNPKMDELEKLLPTDSSSHDDNLILRSKISFFDCGGISVGVCLSHKIADAASFVTFMNAWATTCRDGEASRIISPTFDLAAYFPPGDASVAYEYLSKEKMTMERFVFDNEKIEKLRTEDAASRVSRVEALSAFFWRNFMEADKVKMPACHTVNMRPRTVPPVPDNTFGNCVTLSIALDEDDDDDGVPLVTKLRGAIRAVNHDHIHNVFKDGEKYIEAVNKAGELLKRGNCVFTSLLRFPVYDVDFGWGKPVWVCTATIPLPNLVILMDAPDGGVQAWVNVHHLHHHFLHLLQANLNKLEIVN